MQKLKQDEHSTNESTIFVGVRVIAMTLLKKKQGMYIDTKNKESGNKEQSNGLCVNE